MTLCNFAKGSLEEQKEGKKKGVITKSRFTTYSKN